MQPALALFVRAHCIEVPTATYPVKEFVATFIGQLPASAQASWRRGRIIAELVAAGFKVALGPGGVHVVAGLAPKGALREVDGRLELVSA
jgi:hypothetical protein